ncbi:unnamed protein product [Lathyrus sativus]|nr:unnamed protein product [Lathyrus sativus]
MPYAALLPQLLKLNLVELRTLAPPDPNSLPRNYDSNARCAFHSNAPGHSTEKCRALHMKVQDLVDSKALNFAPPPNVNKNPMPNHGGPRINAIEEDRLSYLITSVDQIRTKIRICAHDRLYVYQKIKYIVKWATGDEN